MEISMPLKETELISIVIPAYNEAQSLPELVSSIDAAMKQHKARFEYVFINDGSTDGTEAALAAIEKKTVRPMTVIHLRKRSGKSAALDAGFLEANGDIIVTIDADLQDDPGEIMTLVSSMKNGSDLVVGWRKERQDSQGKLHVSRMFNWAVSTFFGLKLHDMNSGLKVMRRSVVEEIRLYGELHRFIPVLAAARGFVVSEVPVNHYGRKYGKSKFGIERSFAAFDLLTTLFLHSFRTRPLMIFGPWGVLLTALGGGALVYLSVLHFMGQSIGRRPLLILGVLFVLFGLQLLSTGLLAELISSFGVRNLKHPIKKIHSSVQKNSRC